MMCIENHSIHRLEIGRIIENFQLNDDKNFECKCVFSYFFVDYCVSLSIK